MLAQAARQRKAPGWNSSRSAAINALAHVYGVLTSRRLAAQRPLKAVL
jgi:hypothetical protein